MDPSRVIGYVRDLNARGMAVTVIADRAGVSTAYIAMLLKGYRMGDGRQVPLTKIHQDKALPILAVQYEEPEPARTLGAGTRMTGIGTRRRVQALAYAGFPLKFQGEVIYGYRDGLQAVQRLLRTEGVYAATHNVVKAGYEKYLSVTPDDAGVPPRYQSRIRNIARAREWAPAGCWDDDTIDDPDAVPDWTGYCGTGLGMAVHRRDGIPPCRPCKEAYDFREPYPGFNGLKLRAIREAAGWSRTALARELNFNGDTIREWETGRFRPQRGGRLDRLLSLLDVTYEDVCDLGEGNES